MKVRVTHAQWEGYKDAFSSREERQSAEDRFWGKWPYRPRPGLIGKSLGPPISDVTFPDYAFGPAALSDLTILLIYARRFGGVWNIQPLPVRIG